MERFSALSTESVRVPVSATDDTGALINLPSDTVQMAFKPLGVPPGASDWVPALWSTDTSTTPPTYLAGAMIGPTTASVLTADVWQPWVKIVDAPETKVGEAAEPILVY